MNLRFVLFFLFSFISNYLGAEVELPTFEELSKIEKKYTEIERTCTQRILKKPVEISSFSSRGDARLFLGDFKGARMDYEKMIVLNPNLELSHWRLGIAYFYLSEFKMASRQFEIYHQFDEVDRENGIWRFMSQFQLSGLNKARKGLLRYSQDDRPPYPWLYSMFAGKIAPEDVFDKIKEQHFPPQYEVRVLFHANLYVGIFLELTDDEPQRAMNYLAHATANQYGRSTGTYMWQVARLHHAKLVRSVQKLQN